MPLLIELGYNQGLKVGHARAAIPLVRDVASIHDLTKDVLEISKRHRVRRTSSGASIEHVDGDLGALLQITHGEAIDVGARPSDETKLAATIDEGMEARESQQDSGEVGLALTLVNETLVKCLPGTQQVGTKRLRWLVRDLDRVLENRLRNGLLRRKRGGLRRKEAAEVWVGTLLRLLELTLKGLDPHRHQVDVLQEDPSSLLHAPIKRLLCHRLLPLPHGNVDKLPILDGVSLLLEQRINVANNVCSREEVEEHGCLGGRLAVDAEDVESLLIDKHLAKVGVDHVAKSSSHAVGAHSTKQAHLLEGRQRRIVARWVLGLWCLELHPLIPQLGRCLHVSCQLGEGTHLDKPADALPDLLREECAKLHIHGGGVHVLGTPGHVGNLSSIESSGVLGRCADIRVAQQDLEEDGCHKEQLVLIKEPSAGEVVDLVCDRVGQLLEANGKVDLRGGCNLSILEHSLEACLDQHGRVAEALERVLALALLNHLGHVHAVTRVLLSSQINRLEKHGGKGSERVVVEGVDLEELPESKEEQGPPVGDSAIVLASLVDRHLSLLGNDHLLADLIRHSLGIFQ
mmetsp:Transcript_17843/g.45064  ORF Transcript_17843/g.45064 Transcript_17843/m.45064 type:complete len:573 (-) Transcript_17843:2097-3815(-)